MRILITTTAALLLGAAAATALALHTPPRSAKRTPQPAAQPAPSDAVPGLVWRSGTATLRLTDQPCPSDEARVALELEGVSGARAYEVTQGSRRFTGCWAKDIAGDVVTMEPGKELGQIPIAWFRAGT